MRYAILIVFVFATLATCPSTGTHGQESKNVYEFVPIEKTMLVGYTIPGQNGTSGSAYLTINGEFVRNPIGGISSSKMTSINDPRSRFSDKRQPFDIASYYEREHVYEFREGNLVPGLLEFPGRFIPTIGGKIISVNDYTPENRDAVRIYNLPGTFEKVDPGKRKHLFKRERWEPFAVTVGGLPNPEITHAFRADVQRRVGELRGDKVVLGQLDLKGRFTEDRSTPPVPFEKTNTVAVKNMEGANVEIPVYNYPTVLKIPNGETKFEYVYELRSGALIAGYLHNDGNFEPNPGSIVQKFQDFRYTKDELRIYNLPGKFVPIAK